MLKALRPTSQNASRDKSKNLNYDH